MQTRVAVLALLLLSVPACGDEPIARVHTTSGDVITVTLEVVDTPPARDRGLMYRTTLADGRGMLFVFEDDTDHQFWMKNTLIPLDMLFIDGAGRIVGIHREAVPLTTVPIGVGRPSRYVLEVPGGYAARRGIAVGDRVDLSGAGVP